MTDGGVGLAGYRRRQPARPPRTAEYSALVRSVPCPSCTAAAGQLCTNKTTGQPLGQQVPGHPARARAAVPGSEDAAAPKDAE